MATKNRPISSKNLRKFLGVPADTPICDARVGKHLEVNAEDCRRATRPNKDKSNMMEVALCCAGSRGHQRIYKTPSAIFRTTTYCVEKNAKGAVILSRYMNSTAMRQELVMLNDNPNAKPHAGGFDLLPVPKERRIVNVRKYDRKRRKLQRAGEWKPTPNRSRRGKGRRQPALHDWLRSGGGLVHL